jgi:hypothetical protein
MPGPVLSVFIATFIVTLSAVGASAAPPTVEYLFPAGAPQGTTVEVTAGGKLDEWPLKLWADHPGITAEFSKDKGKLSVKVEAAVPAGPHLVRLYGAQGPAAPRVFVVGTGKEAREAEPNDEVSKAQPVDALPVTINGRLEKSGDVDSYAVKVEAGQWLSATVTGRRLGSPMDPLIHLYEATGNQLAFVHDGLGLDPLLVYRAQKAGTYVVRVAAFKYPPAADVKLAGEAEDVYRLTLSNAPPPRFAMPAGVTRGAKGSVHLFGWDSAETGTREVDATHLADGADTLAVDDLPVAVGDGPERAEAEVTEPLAAPAAVTGFLRTAGEQDAYRFAAKKGERVTVEASAAALASPMDAVLRLQDDSGKELAANDDERGQAGDARLEWTAPADGVYRVVVTDLYGNGGTEYVYRLALSVPAPRIVATADADEYRVAPGKSVSVKLNVSRQGGYAAGLVAVASGLPAGVTATSADVPDKGGDLTLTFTAAADARPAAGPIRVMLLGTDPAHPVAWVACATLRKEASQELIPRTDALWLTVPPP